MQNHRRFLMSMILLFSLLAGGLVAEPFKSPPTTAGKVLDEWLQMANAGDRQQATAFVGQRFTPEFLQQLPIDAMVAFHLQMHEAQGKLTVRRLLESSELRIRVLAAGAVHAEQPAGDESGWLEVTIAVEAEEPHRISQLRVVEPKEEAADS